MVNNELSIIKTEKIAAEELIRYVNKIDCVDYDIKMGEKGISWDGIIRLYKNKEIDKKENFLADVDIQVKGKKIYKRNKGNTISYPIDIDDLKNYFKKNGTIFFVGTINVKKDNECTLYCKPLLRVELFNLLNSKNKNQTISIKLKKVYSISELERTLYNFNTERNIQSTISNKVLSNPTKFIDSRAVNLTFYEYGKTKPSDLIGEEKYLYQKDENDNIIGILTVKLQNLFINRNVSITSKDKEITYDNVIIKKDKLCEIVSFGKSFEMPLEKKELNITIKGTLNDRIKDLLFTTKIIKDGKYLIDDKEAIVRVDEKEFVKYNSLLNKYQKIKLFLDSKNINKDLKLDLWESNEIEQLYLIIRGIEDNINLIVEEWDNSILCAYKIHELTLSILATKQENGSFHFDSFYNNSKEMSFLLDFTDGKKIQIQNKYLGIDRYLYTCDDLNIKEMKNKIDETKIEEDEIEIINRQILEMIFAYDEIKNIELLDLASYYQLKIKDKIDNEVYKLNEYQIKKRKGYLSENDEYEIIKIKNNSKDNVIKIACSILLDSDKEAIMILNNLKQSTREYLYKNFPIINLLKNKHR